MSAAISDMVGVSSEPNMGNKVFDPLGFAEKNPEMVPFYREAELKHGRQAMLAVTGLICADFVRIPGEVYQVFNKFFSV